MTKLSSIARGALPAVVVGLAVAIASLEIDASLRIGVLVLAHALVPVTAAWWGTKPDSLALDTSLALVGVIYTSMMLFMPRGAWDGGTYVTMAVGYAAFAFASAAGFGALRRWRRAARAKGLLRARAQRSQLRAEPSPAE
jgi:hypothetical protein